MIRLYDYPLSGNCFKVRQMLSWLGLAWEPVAVDFHPGKAHKSSEFLANVNPRGQLPVIDDDGFMLRDAQAILVYLASRYDQENRWYPESPRLRGEIAMWLATADEITATASAARLHDAFGYALDVRSARAGAHALFRLMDDHLAERASAGQRWLVGEGADARPTIADLACFPYVALAPEGGIDLDAYPALRRWVRDVRHVSGFIGMPGIFVPLAPA
ncbi:glutathione S-transferase [Variovorax dokdonensis]|uniref:Glutathione S-transferase n=1 Tax=Variovorax dokdonensis TaxID=344883 RepID=A0ABT7N8M8_9BURK|nr:glutathione S-transferase [Variovorax dokdonensis]MDM0044271.1 glutathione S-transferase [Variovorax dokdonensis]